MKKDAGGTGGGKRMRQELTQMERRIVGLLGEARIEGIAGGVDAETWHGETQVSIFEVFIQMYHRQNITPVYFLHNMYI